jgi:hypothetical protein
MFFRKKQKFFGLLLESFDFMLFYNLLTLPVAHAHSWWKDIKLLKPTCHVMHQQFNIQQLYALPTLYLCVLYLSEIKQRLVPITA